ncbi:hypothetical protein C1631_023430, partial [Chryseobacterium phosphatilyticum]
HQSISANPQGSVSPIGQQPDGPTGQMSICPVGPSGERALGLAMMIEGLTMLTASPRAVTLTRQGAICARR